jgi:cytochrome c biogenesis factor
VSHELRVFFAAAAVTVVAGFVVRWMAKEDSEPFKAEILNFSTDLFAAATAVFPTTLIIQSRPNKTIDFSPAQLAALLVLILAIPLWARFDARYFAYWRKGERRRIVKGKLVSSEQAAKPMRTKTLGFVIGNGLGLAVLCMSTVLSQQVAP